VTTGTAIFVEAFGTSVLAFVVFALTHPKNDAQINKVYIPPLIGLTVAGLVSILAPLTQCGINPARDFGPRIVAYIAGWGDIAFKGWWVYVLGPIIGAPIGAFLADRVLYTNGDENCRAKVYDSNDDTKSNEILLLEYNV
jgi:glycerol uptake facilitator-like aquaporin